MRVFEPTVTVGETPEVRLSATEKKERVEFLQDKLNTLESRVKAVKAELKELQ